MAKTEFISDESICVDKLFANKDIKACCQLRKNIFQLFCKYTKICACRIDKLRGDLKSIFFATIQSAITEFAGKGSGKGWRGRRRGPRAPGTCPGTSKHCPDSGTPVANHPGVALIWFGFDQIWRRSVLGEKKTRWWTKPIKKVRKKCNGEQNRRNGVVEI